VPATKRTTPTLADCRSVLRERWGFPDFRHHQKRAVLAALRGRDCLAVLPTGGGKSLCFQIPALALPGLTVVISPLISLMQDQVASLRDRGVAAAYLSSTQRPALRSAVMNALRARRLKLLYMAPERLGGLVPLLACCGVDLLAIDEAHCISEWGHDFRPHYRALGRHRAAVDHPPVIALTATATPQTLRDVTRVLALERPVRIAQSFDRPNLRFEARRLDDDRTRLRVLAELVRCPGGSVIVYVPTRNQADGVAAVLREWGFSALPYHAALPAAARRGLLARFLDGRTRIMVATNAFGMGIDKPDVRLVAHLGVPPRPEAYFQEAGRAGRDGKPARCIMLWRKGDLVLARRLSGADRALSAIQREARRRALATMRSYVHTRGCRRRVLLGYLGERLGHCSGCDGCDRRSGMGPVGLSQNASSRAQKRSAGASH